MTPDAGFAWIVLPLPAGSRYKLTDLTDWQPDPWARAYHYDDFGVMTQVAPTTAHLERYFNVTDGVLPPRRVRVLVPAAAPTRVLYTHDGQNLFDPDAFFGGWKLDQSAPPATLIVGIDNAGAARLDEYGPTPDDIGRSGLVGGQGDLYADYVQTTIRGLVAAHYGEPATVGLMGSSMGGLISLHIAHRYPGAYDFAASLSGTLGWGSIGLDGDTVLTAYLAAGEQPTVLYIDTGGGADGCVDADGDGIEDDDPTANDNYCENLQFASAMIGLGYVEGSELLYHWEAGATHDEAAWAARVWRPLQAFAGL
jgi:predicted alpha/beta superfamily hydrolase